VVKIADPKAGLVGQSEFIPSMAAINKWVDNELFQITRREQHARNTIFTLEYGDDDVSRETEAERQAHVDRVLNRLSPEEQRIASLEEALKPTGWPYPDIKGDDWVARKKALENLDSEGEQGDGNARVSDRQSTEN